MALFEPTPEEIAASSYLKWNDAALGKFTKDVALCLERGKDDADGLHRVISASCAMLLVTAAWEANAGNLTLTMTGHSHAGIETGDWKIIIKRIKAPKK